MTQLPVDAPIWGRQKQLCQFGMSACHGPSGDLKACKEGIFLDTGNQIGV